VGTAQTRDYPPLKESNDKSRHLHPQGEGWKGVVCLAIDYRYVNKFTVSNPYPIPDLADIVQQVVNARYISTFDATKSYYQTPVREQDRWLTAFVCEFGIFEFTRTPFGMRSSGATFVRTIQRALQPVRKIYRQLC